MFAYLMIGFNAVMPMHVYMLIGLFLAKTGLMQQSTFRDINKALFAILLPINLFTNIYRSDFQ
jgi:predicted permease